MLQQPQRPPFFNFQHRRGLPDRHSLLLHQHADFLAQFSTLKWR
jgi:hypothetical protein